MRTQGQTELEVADSVALFVACRQWLEAEAAARANLAALREAPGSHPLELARATRRIADVMIEAQRADEASGWVAEARGLYRPFIAEPGPLAELSLTLANHALATRRSAEAGAALEVALRATQSEPELRLWCARALRLKAHIAILRGDFLDGAGLVDEALRCASSSESGGALLEAQYLFTRAEVHVMLEERARARGAVAAALDFVQMRLSFAPDFCVHANARAAMIYAANGDTELATQLAKRGGLL